MLRATLHVAEDEPDLSEPLPRHRLSGLNHHEVNAGQSLSARSWRGAQLALGLLACALVPAWSWLDGSGSLAWTMYAHSSSFRLRIMAIDEHGTRRSIAPSSLAAQAEQDVATALGGAEAFRHARQGRQLRHYLPRLAELACSVSRAARVELRLEDRPNLDAPFVITEEKRRCHGAQAAP